MPTPNKILSRLAIACIPIPLLVIISVLIPDIAHYYVQPKPLGTEIVESLRTNPSNMVLEELASFSSGILNKLSDQDRLSIARKAFEGELALPMQDPIRISIPFDEQDLTLGTPGVQLLIAALGIPDLFMDAYVKTHDEAFFRAAREYILSWGHYEQSAWLPKGLLWNDHAIAARILVLTKFWGLYRNHPAYNEQDARIILRAIQRSAQLLAKPGHFTFATNHGVMQNLALLHVTVAFPSLPESSAYKEIALKRLKDQMSFYINNEGVVLEHSAGYHEFGIELLGAAFRYMTLLGIPVPKEWWTKYEKALHFYAQLRRPDDTLPMYGDTPYYGSRILPLDSPQEQGYARRFQDVSAWRPSAPFTLTPLAGYAIWWDGLEQLPNVGTLSQTVTTWSYFTGHAHKHADEMSVLLWASGYSWWTNAGYWPYGIHYRDKALSWEGSNAPHLVGESPKVERKTELLHFGQNEQLSFLELQRSRSDGYRVKRQVLHVSPDLWLIIDDVRDKKNRDTVQTWTSLPGTTVTRGNRDNLYILGKPYSSLTLTASFLNSEGGTTNFVQGSTQPFAGWVTVPPRVQQAPAFITHLSANSWSATVWNINYRNNRPSLSRKPTMQRWNNSQDWHISIPLSSRSVEINRDGDNVMLKTISMSTQETHLVLEPGPDITTLKDELKTSYRVASEKYKTYKDFSGYRTKIFFYLIIVLFTQELIFLVYKRLRKQSDIMPRLACTIVWIAIGVWLPLFYFVT